MSRRTPSTFKPDPSLDSVFANDIGDQTIEDRHLADNEILPSKIATVEEAVALEAKLGVPFAIEYEIAADASSGVDIIASVAQKFRVVDIVVEARATSGSGTVIVRNGTTGISAAIAMAADEAVARAADMVAAEATFEVGDVLNVITNGAADRGIVTLHCVKLD